MTLNHDQCAAIHGADDARFITILCGVLSDIRRLVL